MLLFFLAEDAIPGGSPKREQAMDPRSLANNVSMLKGEDRRYRMRVGDLRVIFTDDGQILAILKIAPRSKAYD